MKKMIFFVFLLSTHQLMAATLYYGQDLVYNYQTNKFVSDTYITLDETNTFSINTNQDTNPFIMFTIPYNSSFPEWTFSIPLNNYTPDTNRYFLDDPTIANNFLLGNRVISIDVNNSYYSNYGGYFDVRELTYYPDTLIINSLAVDFHLLIEGEDYFGALRFNSDISVTPVPLPAALWLFVFGLITLTATQRSRKSNNQ